MIKKYRKKPVVIEAIQWTGDSRKNSDDCLMFIGASVQPKDHPPISGITLTTLEGVLTVSKGDFIIKGIQGEFYPCKPDIFKATYEEID